MLQFNSVLKELQEIQRLYHDSSKKIPTNVTNEVAAKLREKLEKNKKEAEQKASELKGSVGKNQSTTAVELVDKILEDIRQKELISTTEKAPLSEPPPESKKYGIYFDSNVYHELLAYTKLAYLSENIGLAEDHALKLAVLFGDTQSALNYLKNSASVYEACLFTLPSVDKSNFNAWRAHAKKENFMTDPGFREMLPFAEEIESLINISNAESKKKPDQKLIKAKKEEIAKNNTRWRILQRKHGDLTEDEEEEFVALSKERMKLNAELIEISASVPLADADLLLLLAYNEKEAMRAHPAYKYFRSHGLTKKDHQRFLALDRSLAGKNIPNVTIDGNDIGYPGIYLKKVNSQDEKEAARMACGGKLTGCCQSVSGEAGEPCAIHGLTSQDGGFYVVCRGEAAHPKIEDEVLGLSWAWRSKSGGLVLDSVEISKDRREDSDKNRLTDFMRFLAFKVANDESYAVSQVTCGNYSGISNKVGLMQMESNQFPRDYEGYRDSNIQLQVAEKNMPYLLLNKFNSPTIQKIIDKFAIEFVITELQKELSVNENDTLRQIINYAVWHNQVQFLTLINQHGGMRSAEIESYKLMIAVQMGKKELVQSLLDKGVDINTKSYDDETPLTSAVDVWKTIQLLLARDPALNEKIRQNPTHPMLIAQNQKEMVGLLLERGAKIDTQNKNGETPLFIATKLGLKEIAALLLNSKADPNKQNKEGETPLMAAVRNARKEIVIQLLASDANVNLKNNNNETALMIAARMGQKEIVELLLAKSADVKVQNNDGNTALMLASTGDVVLQLLKKDAEIDEVNNNGDSALILAVQRRQRLVVDKLLRKGANKDLKNKEGKDAISLATDPAIRDLLVKSKTILEKPKAHATKLIYSKLPKLPKSMLSKADETLPTIDSSKTKLSRD